MKDKQEQLDPTKLWDQFLGIADKTIEDCLKDGILADFLSKNREDIRIAIANDILREHLSEYYQTEEGQELLQEGKQLDFLKLRELIGFKEPIPQKEMAQ